MVQNKKPKVDIGGVYYGLHNIGDEAILFSMLKEFGAYYDVSVGSYDSDWIKKYYSDIRFHGIPVSFGKTTTGIMPVPRKKVVSNFRGIQSLKSTLAACDGYICGGATILSDCPYHSLTICEWAGKLGKPVVLWGVGFADGTTDDVKAFVRKILNEDYIKQIYTRDEFVKKRLEEVGVTGEKIYVSYDPAIMLTGTGFEISDYLNEKAISLLENGRKNICFGISGERDVVSRTPVGEIVNAVKGLEARGVYNVFLIPTGCGEHCKDRDILKEIEMVCSSEYVVAVEKEFEPQHLVSFLSAFEFVISSRLHLNIFAACAGKPSIGLVRNSKIVDFATLLNLPYLEMGEISSKRISELVDELEQNYDTYEENIKKEVGRMRKQQANALNHLVSSWLK